MNIAYHWNANTMPILCIPSGIARTADAISTTAGTRPLGLDRISAISSSVGGISFVDRTESKTVPMEQTAPIQNATNTQVGRPPPVSVPSNRWNANSDRFAVTAPAPTNMLCVRKPRANWLLGSLSEMKARYGSIAVLLDMSSSHRSTTANHSTATNGQRNRQIEQPIAPIRKYGFLRPHLGLHVRSLIAPMSGWTNRPVIGPARFRMGRLCASAPINWKIGFIAVCCRPKLYWIPKNPKFIRRICVKVNGGLRSRATLRWASGCAAIAMREPPVYVSGPSVMVRLTRMSCDLRSVVSVRLTVGSCCHPIYEL